MNNNRVCVCDRECIGANNTSTRSHSPFLNPVLRFVTSTDPTVAACFPE